MVEIKKSANRQWYFVIKAANNEIIATSEMYKQRQSALKGIAALKKAMALHETGKKQTENIIMTYNPHFADTDNNEAYK